MLMSNCHLIWLSAHQKRADPHTKEIPHGIAVVVALVAGVVVVDVKIKFTWFDVNELKRADPQTKEI